MYIFDLDGTLIDSNGVWARIDMEFMDRHGLTLTDEYEEFVKFANFAQAAQYTKEYGNLSESPEEIMREWMDMAYDEYARKIPLKPYAREILEKCAAKGEGMALYTSSIPELCYAALDHHDLRKYFDDIIFTNDFGGTKHEAASFRYVEERLGVRPEECRLFDDSPRTCAGAMAAGWNVFGVYDELVSGGWSDFQQCAHRCIRNFFELIGEKMNEEAN